jgi:sialate O-acetylesterase
VAADADAALIVTVDVGDVSNLHPPDKQDVGRRAALAARKLIYGEAIPATGPNAEAVAVQGAEVVIRFRDDGGGLIVYSAADPGAFELCGTAIDSCRFASARIDGPDVRLAIPGQMTPTRVRHCWGDAPLCNLFDRAGLPAGPFELPLARKER